MSFNSSSSSNDSLSSSNSSLSLDCSVFTRGRATIVVAYTVTKILLLLPLYVPVLYLGLRKWRRERSCASMSHSDFFTYHMFGSEMVGLLGVILYCFSIYAALPKMMKAAQFIYMMSHPGQMLLHTLNCVEHYLAVVHPITYLALRKANGVRNRNIIIGCVWLLCFVWLAFLESPVAPFFCLLAFALIVTGFCSLSVLRALKRPGPGEAGGDRERVDQSKQRAFYTIMAIMGVLFFWLVGFLVASALGKSQLVSKWVQCMVSISGLWFSLPSSSVLPLLFLHRARKLKCCH